MQQQSAPQQRVDVPLLLRAFKSSDLVTAQNGGAILGVVSCRSEEYREAIAAQLESLHDTLVAHLASGESTLTHNAALLLGQCAACSSEFRQSFCKNEEKNMNTLVQLLSQKDDAGLLCNVTWAVRHLVADPECIISSEIREHLASYLCRLLHHDDERIKANAHAIGSALQHEANIRNVALTLRRDKSMAAVSALTELVEESPHDSAVHALVGLNSQSPKSSPPQTPSPHVMSERFWSEQPPTTRHVDMAPTTHHGDTIRHSPGKQQQRRPSLLSPWKKASGCEMRHKRPHKVAVAKHHMANLSALSLAVTQAADG